MIYLLSVNKLIVPSDKTTSLYYIIPRSYNKLMHESITTGYKVTNDNTVAVISDTAKNLGNQKNKKNTKYVTN